jgi:dTDP-4-amino-4,6-dideoxygalactose transaminase
MVRSHAAGADDADPQLADDGPPQECGGMPEKGTAVELIDRSGLPMTSPHIPISRVELGPEVEALVLEVVRSGHLAQGPMVERLERTFCDLVGTAHAVAVGNGTLALVAAIQALGIEAGSEIVTSPFTFVATVNAALEAGARVRFADIDLSDFNVNLDEVAHAITPATSVLMPVHLYGHPAGIGPLASLAEQHGLALIEDACQSHGASVDGKVVGSFGIGCFSLYATKNVTTGEGGIITTNDVQIADRLRVLRNQGMRARYQYEMAGHNYRMTDLQAAIGIPQMEQLETATKERATNAAFLSDALGGIEGLVLPSVRTGCRHVWHQYTVRVTPDARLSRDVLVAELKSRGIGTGVYYPKVVFDYDAYRDHPMISTGSFPNAETAAREVVSLPVHPHLREADLDRIATEIRALLA